MKKWKIKVHEESDFVGDKDKRLSVTTFSIHIFGCLVSWNSLGQETVTLSSTEAHF